MIAYDKWLQGQRARLADAAIEAEPLVSQGRFDEAEKVVRAVDSDIYGALTLGDVFTSVLKRVVQSPNPDRAFVQTLHERALHWRRAWPGVHTREEAEAERAHVEEVRRELAALLCFLPHAES